MWKESYRLGVDSIDEQHIELFRMTNELMKEIQSKADESVFADAIGFLKEYVVYHFAEEEAYQVSISYSGLVEHQKLHAAFTNTVLEFEKRLLASKYDMGVIKEMAGMLSAWLIYHVADADQKIVTNEPVSGGFEQQSCILSVTTSVLDVLEKMAGLDSVNMEQQMLSTPEIHGDIFVELGLQGDVAGHVYFSFSKQLAFKLIEIMLLTTPEAIDELVCSVLAEISNIASGNAASALSEHGITCDITIPAVTIDQRKKGAFETVYIDTGFGNIGVSVALDF